jgi:hypothetical protein
VNGVLVVDIPGTGFASAIIGKLACNPAAHERHGVDPVSVSPEQSVAVAEMGGVVAGWTLGLPQLIGDPPDCRQDCRMLRGQLLLNEALSLAHEAAPHVAADMPALRVAGVEVGPSVACAVATKTAPVLAAALHGTLERPVAGQRWGDGIAGFELGRSAGSLPFLP